MWKNLQNLNTFCDLIGSGRSNVALQFRFMLFTIFVLILMIFSYDFFDHYISFSFDSISYGKNFSQVGLEEYFPYVQERIDISEILPNCGIKHQCGDEEFPVHVYTGQDKDDQPKLCVGGRYVHGVGRGLNIAVIESAHARFKSLRNFDLYSQNSSALEAWLEHDLNQDDIIIAFTFDEASKELSKNAKETLYLLGSGKIQDLQFRCQWYMISQKGIKGFSPLEEITYGKNYRWGKAIDKRLCVAKRIEALMVSADPLPRQNPLRERLCELSAELKNDRFCGDAVRHEPLFPSQLTDRSLIGNAVFSTPIIVIPGISLSSLALTLETLLYQPGIQPANVYIIHARNQVFVPTMAKIFGFRCLMANSTFPLTTNDKIEFGLSYILEHFPKKQFVIVIEEGLILSADYLYFMAQLVPFLDQDDTLLGISGWNPYGFKGTSGNPKAVYRTEDFPGLGFLIRMSVFIKVMRGRMSQCCHQKSFIGWNTLDALNNTRNDLLVPDVSRVLRRPKDYLSRKRRDSEFYLFTTPRITNRDTTALIDGPTDLLKQNYDNAIMLMINSSISLRFSQEDLKNCANSNATIVRVIRELRNKTLTVYYNEERENSTDKLRIHLRCFNITVLHQERIHNCYKRVVRLTVHSNAVILVDGNSIFSSKVSS